MPFSVKNMMSILLLILESFFQPSEKIRKIDGVIVSFSTWLMPWIIMEGTTKYGSSPVLLTSVSSGEEEAKEIEGFPCVSPLDDGRF